MPQPDAASFLGLSERTLERFRLEGTGPIFRKFGRRVLYAPDDLTAWADAQSRTSTSDDSHTAQR
ncbi:MAG: helix-turn-helix transcriptional regulator [Pseudomonadota bacterium]